MSERMPFNPGEHAEPAEHEAEQDDLNDTEKKISRRSFLKKSGLIAAGFALAPYAEKARKVFDLEGAKTEGNKVDSEKSNEVSELRKYKTGPLEGNVFSEQSLFYYFTGISGQVPAEVDINFSSQLNELFKKKAEWAQRHHKHNNAFVKADRQLEAEYIHKNPEKMNFTKYQKHVQNAIDEVNKHIEWHIVKQAMHLDSRKQKLLAEVSKFLKAEHLTAYALTELMPSSDGELNKNVYEFLLKNAGARYIYSIPAIYDDRLSFGPYQFTSGALEDDGQHRIGASVINAALPKGYKIPQNVSELRGNDHHKAAFLFAIYNLASLLQRLDEKEMDVFEKHWRVHIVGVTEFIATAHHLPGAAFSAAKRWLDANVDHEFEVSCHNSIKGYAQKTRANLLSLKA